MRYLNLVVTNMYMKVRQISCMVETFWQYFKRKCVFIEVQDLWKCNCSLLSIVQ